jgi:hypothetical protein
MRVGQRLWPFDGVMRHQGRPSFANILEIDPDFWQRRVHRLSLLDGSRNRTVPRSLDESSRAISPASPRTGTEVCPRKFPLEPRGRRLDFGIGSSTSSLTPSGRIDANLFANSTSAVVLQGESSPGVGLVSSGIRPGSGGSPRPIGRARLGEGQRGNDHQSTDRHHRTGPEARPGEP